MSEIYMFDDYTEKDMSEFAHRFRYWTQVCKDCKKKLQLNRSGVAPNGSGICGVKGCSNEADYYYDFN